jgi:hypothetical protein
MAENLIMAVVIRDAEKPPPPCPLPAWARASDARVDASDCALFAGAALAALDPIVRANAPFAGVWRQRLALRAAAATVRMTGRREAEADLRDAWYLRAKGDALGPAGEHLRAWRLLASKSSLSLEGLRHVALCFELNTSNPLTQIFANTKRAIRSGFAGRNLSRSSLRRSLIQQSIARRTRERVVRKTKAGKRLLLSLTHDPRRPRSTWPATSRAVPTSFSRSARNCVRKGRGKSSIPCWKTMRSLRRRGSAAGPIAPCGASSIAW